MSDRANRSVIGLVGLLLAVGGGLCVCLGAGVFGTSRSNRAVFDSTIIRWWNEGGWSSFAVVVAIGLVAVAIGVLLSLAQLRRTDARQRTPSFAFPSGVGGRGETSLRGAALSHGIQADLENIDDIHHAAVAVLGGYPDLELRAVLVVSDNADLEHLRDSVDEAVARMETTVGIRPRSVRITVRFADTAPVRRLA
jgi:hypothetical protein